MERKRVIVYPVTFDERSLLFDYERITDIHLKGLIMSNKYDDWVKQADRGEDLIITDDFESALQACEEVIFLDTEEEKVIENIKRFIEIALEKKKGINVSHTLAKKLDLNEEEFSLFGVEDRTKVIKDTDLPLKRIDCPVIHIVGNGSFCECFETGLKLNAFFTQKGHRVLQISDKEISGFFRVRRFPELLYGNKLSYAQKILTLNEYLYSLNLEHHPEIMIISTEEPIMPMNRKVHHNFGEIPKIIGEAVNIDIGILGMNYMEEVPKELIEKYYDYCRFCLKCPVDYFLVSGTMTQIDADNEDKMHYYHLNETTSHKKLEIKNGQHRVDLFSINNTSGMEETFDDIYKQLATNIDVF